MFGLGLSKQKEGFLLLLKLSCRERWVKVYTNIVVSCLACLDKSGGAFGDISEFGDEDGILVGVRYIEKANSKMLSLRPC